MRKSDCVMFQEKQTLKASVSTLNVTINDSTQLSFAKLYIKKPQDFWIHVLWTDESKVEIVRL